MRPFYSAPALAVIYLLPASPLGTPLAESQTTVTMRQEADAQLESATKELKRTYAELYSKVQDDGDLKKRLSESQKAWEVYRDKTMALESAFYMGGTILPQIRLQCLTRLTRLRIEELRSILKNEFG